MIETIANLVLERGGYDMLPSAEARSTLANPEGWFTEWATGGSVSSSGESVSPSTAQKFAAVQGAHRFLSEVEASLPCHLYLRRPDGRGKDRATDHYLYPLLHDAPNAEQTAFEFWQAMRQNRAAWGNAYALPLYGGNGRWTEIIGLRPDWMTVTRNVAGKKLYQYRPAWGPHEGNYLASEIIHVRGMGDDLVGWSPIRLLREGIGLGMAAQKASASFFKNGAKMSGILELAGKVRSIEDESNKFNEKYAGAKKTGSVLVIDQGSKFVSTTIPPDDAQFIATWKASREEVWMVYGIPPHLMGDTEKATSWGAGIEQQVIGLQKFTLTPSLKMTRQSFQRVLLGPWDRSMFIEFDIDGLLEGDAKTREEVLSIRRQNGIINADDWRTKVNENPIGGEVGGAYLVNGTMIPVTVALAKSAAPATPQQ